MRRRGGWNAEIEEENEKASLEAKAAETAKYLAKEKARREAGCVSEHQADCGGRRTRRRRPSRKVRKTRKHRSRAY